MYSLSNRGRWMASGRSLLVILVGLLISQVAWAEVTKQGTWPDNDPLISLEVSQLPRNEALKRLAKEAGWSLVVNIPFNPQSNQPVDIDVKDQPASKVLEVLLTDGNYMASRDGNLVSISPSTGTQRSIIVSVDGDDDADDDAEHGSHRRDHRADHAKRHADHDPPKDTRGRDRTVTGTSLRIEKGEVVHDVSVFGGSVDVWGTVTGDIDVMGGSIRIHEGAEVRGDASAVGGSLTVDDGARVMGDVEVVGGALKRGEKAIIGGDVTSKGDEHDISTHPSQGVNLSDVASDTGNSLTRMALFFLFGAMMLALAPRRMETLKVDIVAHPMKSAALGIVGILGSIVVFVALCVTVVGIPLALVGLLLAFVATIGSICAVLETAGAAVLGHKTKNPYIHLAVGCLGLLILGAIPYLGGILYALVILMGIGALVSTRLAGYIRPRGSVPNGHPYRSPA